MLKFRRWSGWTVGTLILALSVHENARGEDAMYVGRHGWALEHFGTDVTLLRTAQPIGGRPTDEAALIFSCDGEDHRLQLTLPAGRMPSDLAAAQGYAIFRSLDKSGAIVASVTVRFSGKGVNTMVVTNVDVRDTDDPILRIARMLEAQPIGLDLLVRSAATLGTLGRSTPLRFSLSVSDNDGIAFREFHKVCPKREKNHKG